MFRYLFKICNGRCFSFLKGFDHDHIFHSSSQSMACKPLGIGYTDTVQVVGKGCLQSCYFCISAASPCRSISFMGHEKKLICILCFSDAILFFNLCNEFFHLMGHVGHINIKCVVCRVGNMRTKNLTLTIHASFLCTGFPFNNKANSTCPDDSSITVFIKRLGSFRHPLFYGGSTHGEKS